MSSSIAFASSSAIPKPNSFVGSKVERCSPRSGSRNASVRQRSDVRAILRINKGITRELEQIALPQHDAGNRMYRRDAIREARDTYKWTKEEIGTASMIEGLPDSERPHLGWIEDVAGVFLRVAANNAAIDAREFGEDAARSMRKARLAVTSVFGEVMRKIFSRHLDSDIAQRVSDRLFKLIESRSERPGCCFEDYKDDFILFEPDTVAGTEQYLSDEMFGWYRVAGPNPMRITKLRGTAQSFFPALTNEIFRGVSGFENDTLEEAEQEGRLFYVDYKEFDGVEPGTLPDGTKKNGYYLYSPKCLLAVPKRLDIRTTVLPIAIQCGQDESFPMYTANPEHTDAITWLASKLTVQVADAVSHEVVYHLGRTHLLVEVFVCASYRTLAPNHPLLKLLVTHFYGTAFINSAASNRLIGPGGVIDNITAPQIEVAKDLAAKSICSSTGFSFDEWMPDKELASRGVKDAERLKYPYRDDAMKLWNVINEWVKEYLYAFYESDDDVMNDEELSNWCREITSNNGGCLLGFGETESGQIVTREYLVRAVAMVIFTASAQHAAVNFPQSTMMQFVPAMPLCGYAPPPKTAKPFQSVEHLMEEMLPNMAKAQMQMNTAELIGVVRYKSLGDYGTSLQFAPAKVQRALRAFKSKLKSIESQIEARNDVEKLAGLPEYDHMIPRNIPQSINI